MLWRVRVRVPLACHALAKAFAHALRAMQGVRVFAACCRALARRDDGNSERALRPKQGTLRGGWAVRAPSSRRDTILKIGQLKAASVLLRAAPRTARECPPPGCAGGRKIARYRYRGDSMVSQIYDNFGDLCKRTLTLTPINYKGVEFHHFLLREISP